MIGRRGRGGGVRLSSSRSSRRRVQVVGIGSALGGQIEVEGHAEGVVQVEARRRLQARKEIRRPISGPFPCRCALFHDGAASADAGSSRGQVISKEESASARVPGLEEVVGLALGPDGDGLDVLVGQGAEGAHVGRRLACGGGGGGGHHAEAVEVFGEPPQAIGEGIEGVRVVDDALGAVEEGHGEGARAP